VAKHRGVYEGEYAAIRPVATKLGVAAPEMLRQLIRLAELRVRQRTGMTSEELAEIRAGGTRSTPRCRQGQGAPSQGSRLYVDGDLERDCFTFQLRGI
jgi:hypothetical protein